MRFCCQTVSPVLDNPRTLMTEKDLGVQLIQDYCLVHFRCNIKWSLPQYNKARNRDGSVRVAVAPTCLFKIKQKHLAVIFPFIRLKGAYLGHTTLAPRQTCVGVSLLIQPTCTCLFHFPIVDLQQYSSPWPASQTSVRRNTRLHWSS